MAAPLPSYRSPDYLRKRMPDGRRLDQVLRGLDANNQPMVGAPVVRSRALYTQNETRGVFGPTHTKTFTGEVLSSVAERKALKRSEILGVTGPGGKMINPATPLSGRKSANQIATIVQLWTDPNFDPNNPDSYFQQSKQGGPQYGNRASVPVAPNKKDARTAAAPILIVPTTTTNPQRPRTVAAGYEVDDPYSDLGKLTCVFRDGTFYNYYDVPIFIWEGFRQAPSKGKYIKSILDKYPRGPSDVSAIPVSVRATLYRYASTAQGYWNGSRQSASSKAPMGVTPKKYLSAP